MYSAPVATAVALRSMSTSSQPGPSPTPIRRSCRFSPVAWLTTQANRSHVSPSWPGNASASPQPTRMTTASPPNSMVRPSRQALGASRAGNAGRSASRNTIRPTDSTSATVRAHSWTGMCRTCFDPSESSSGDHSSVACRARVSTSPPTWNSTSVYSAAFLRRRSAAPSTTSSSTMTRLALVGTLRLEKAMSMPLSRCPCGPFGEQQEHREHRGQLDHGRDDAARLRLPGGNARTRAREVSHRCFRRLSRPVGGHALFLTSVNTGWLSPTST